jgi:predicted phosphatase
MEHIFLDFDRTLFDTERFYTMTEATYIQSISKGEILDLKSFLYPDVIDFLQWCKGHGHCCYLLTFGGRSIQESKFLACNISEYFEEMFYVEQGRKVDYIKNAFKSRVSYENIVFIDDTISHLEDFVSEIPNGIALRMCRHGAKGSNIKDRRFTSVSNFGEIKKLVVF